MAEVRAGILKAAEKGDYEMLRPFLDPEVFLSDFGFGVEDEPDPIARWESMDEKPLKLMAILLRMEHAVERTNEGRLYRWPIYDAETKSLKDLRARDRKKFLSVMNDEQVRRLVPNDEYGYVGPRLGILENGTWWFFLIDPRP